MPACVTSLRGSALAALRALMPREPMLVTMPIFELSFRHALGTSHTRELYAPVNWTVTIHDLSGGATFKAACAVVRGLAMNFTFAKLESLIRSTGEARISLEGRGPMDGALTPAHERLIEAYAALVSGKRRATVDRTIAFSHCVLRMAGTADVCSEERLAVYWTALCAEQIHEGAGHALTRP